MFVLICPPPIMSLHRDDFSCVYNAGSRPREITQDMDRIFTGRKSPAGSDQHHL